MKGASCNNGSYVAFQQTVFALCKESCYAQSCKSQDIVAAYLEESKHIRLLDKLQDAVCQTY